MHKKRFCAHVLGALSALSLSGIALSSCSESIDYSVPANEEYTREFIKEFGLIDPAQDWNMATSGTVTVNVPGHAKSVKIYAKVAGKYYIVADLTDIEGRVVIPVDIPETTNDLMVKIDGKRYYTTNGGTVNIGSRSLPDADYVSVDYDNYIEFNMDIIYAITSSSGILPEEGDNDTKTEIVKNFTVKYDGNPFTFYPVYFNTSSNHVLGVCWFVSESEATETVGVETTVKDGYAKIRISENENDYLYVRKLPVYMDKIGPELQYSDTDPHAEAEDAAGHVAEKAQYLWSDAGEILNYISVDLGEIWSDSGDVVDDDKFATLKDEIIDYYKDKPITAYCSDCNSNPDNFEVYDVRSAGNRYVTLLLRHTPSSQGVGEGPWKNYANAVGDYCGTDAQRVYMRAAPITIDLGDYIENGQRYIFYIDVYNSNGSVKYDTYAHTVYSYAPLNYLDSGNENPTPSYQAGTYKTAYGAYYSHTYEDGYRRFFSFEDWAVQTRDLNDLIFMVKTSSLGDDDEVYVPPVIDEDKDPDNPVNPENPETPDPENPEDPETPEVDEALSWIVAAEDLGSIDDFDFNDVVFSITSITYKGEGDAEPVKKVSVKALAAGGTMPVYLHYYDGAADWVLGPGSDRSGVAVKANEADASFEWHKWFGSDMPHTSMINTGGRSVVNTVSVVLSDFVDMSGFSVTDYGSTDNGLFNGFYITVNGQLGMGSIGGEVTNSDQSTATTIIGVAKSGAAPQMFLVTDNGWQWPTERTRIFAAYPDFKTWVGSASADEWLYASPQPGTTCRPNIK